MNARTRWLRLLAGVGVLTVVLVVTFGVALAAIPTWGAAPGEALTRLPGDELAPRPLLNWTNVIEIDAPPSAVWPWIAQLGDTRGGFYSYTFIEDRVGAITGAADYDVDYENANQIMPEWQHPRLGDQIIQGMLKVKSVAPGEYLLADMVDPKDMQWVWMWKLLPHNGGEQTRLLVRFRIQLAAEGDNPMLTSMMTVGGFVMQQRMLHGIKVRAEGAGEPAGIELVEVLLWLTTLAVAAAGAVLFLAQREWRWPLAVAVTGTAVLVAFTFIQPAIWVRVLANAVLLAGLWWGYQPAAGRRHLRLRPQAMAR